MMTRLVLAAALVLTVACAQKPEPPPTPAPVADLNDPAVCAARGGKMSPQGLLGRPMCVITFADGGKTCTDGAQCQSGACNLKGASVPDGVAASGQCRPNNVPFGCFQSVRGGKAGPGLCVD